MDQSKIRNLHRSRLDNRSSNGQQAMSDIVKRLRAEALAKLFHEVYESLAPGFRYETRPDSRTAWENVPEKNRKLMIATAAEVLRREDAGVRASGTPWFPADAREAKWHLDQEDAEIARLQAELDKANTDNWKTVVEETLEAANLNTALLAENERLRAELEQERTAFEQFKEDLPNQAENAFIAAQVIARNIS